MNHLALIKRKHMETELFKIGFRIASGKEYKENNMSKREKFEREIEHNLGPSLWHSHTLSHIMKAYDTIHPPEFKPGDYVTGCFHKRYMSIDIMDKDHGGTISTIGGQNWHKVHVSHSTPEEIVAYDKRCK